MASELLRLLEFDKIRELLAARCQYSVASERAREIAPTADRDQVAYLLRVTREAARLFNERPSFTIGGFRDIRSVVQAAQRGNILAPADVRTVLDTLEVAASLRRQFMADERWSERYPALAEFVLAMVDLPGLRADLARSIGPRGEVLDTASPELAAIRRSLKEAHERLRERLRRLLAERQEAIQDAYVTIRDGRYVIPVRADRRQAVPGITHDVSGSGQTLFVEPFEVLELNNRWRELQAAETHEIERILRVLTQRIADAADELLQIVEAGAALDLALAKARLAYDLDAVEPELLEPSGPTVPEGHPFLRVRLRAARHPLLDRRTAVPIDVELGERFRILVITGPNTGGKTVALKTVGLLALMAQAGLFIPAAPGSGLSVFSAIFVDIGDEQSIEQNLSTFSSHMRRIVATLQQADASSLVLLDEIAAGTDPQEGAALARAILERLLEIGALGIVTTHYPELKVVATGTPGLENASVEFDPVTLSPTYRLLVGLPGRSHALEVARRLGLPEDVIARARELLGSGAPQIDRLIAEMHRRLDEAESLAAAAERSRREAEQLRAAAERLLAEAERERREARQEVLRELEAELARARELARKIERAARSPAYPPIEVTQDSLRALEEVKRRVQSSGRQSGQERVPEIAVGDRVELTALGLEGDVVAIHPESEEVEVCIGQFRVRQPQASVRRIGPRREEVIQTFVPPVSVTTIPRVEPEIHLRGLHVEEALDRLDRYLDRAVRAGLPWVRVVHGKGTGTLRQAIHAFLRDHPIVKSWELAGPHEGGLGVTVVYLQV